MKTTKDQCTITEQSETVRLLPPTDPFKNLIGFARITEMVLVSPGEQLLRLLHTS